MRVVQLVTQGVSGGRARAVVLGRSNQIRTTSNATVRADARSQPQAGVRLHSADASRSVFAVGILA